MYTSRESSKKFIESQMTNFWTTTTYAVQVLEEFAEF